MTYEEFLAFVGPAAMQIEAARGYPAEAVLTQVHLESGGLSAYPEGSNNVLGIKWAGQGEYAEAPTIEYENGVAVRVMAKWQKFDSLTECLGRWADLMDKSWYAQAKPFRKDWAAFLALIWHNGESTVYATDPLYLWKAVKRASEVGIPAWCAAYRRQMQEPEVAVYLDDVRLLDTYRLVKGSVTGKLRALLNVMKLLGYTFTYDPRARVLKIKRGAL